MFKNTIFVILECIVTRSRKLLLLSLIMSDKMIFVEKTAIFHTKVYFRKIGERSITWNFDPQYFQKQPEVGHLPEFFFMYGIRVEKSPLINVLSGWYLAQSEPGLKCNATCNIGWI